MLVGRSAQDFEAAALQRLGDLKRRLAAELDDHAQGLFHARDIEHVLRRQRLEVKLVRDVEVRAHGLGIGVDHDRLDAGRAKSHRGMHAAVVELDALADAVGPAAQDHDLGAGGDAGLVLAAVAAVEIGRFRFELGRAGVDRVESAVHAGLFAVEADLVFGQIQYAGESRDPSGREP